MAERLKAHTPNASEKVYEDSILDQLAQHIKQGLPHPPTRGADRTSCHGAQRTPVGVATTDTHSVPPCPLHTTSRQQAHGVFGEVGATDICPSTFDTGERFQHASLFVKPTQTRRRVEHGVLAADVIRR